MSKAGKDIIEGLEYAIEQERKPRLIAIPDIHGEFHKLQVVMRKLAQTWKLDLNSDKLIFLGDYVDRGLDSARVLKYIRELQEKHPDNVILLAGNHEWMMIDAVTKGGEDMELWNWNGGRQTALSFSMNSMDMREYTKWLASLPLQHEEPGFFFSHAPVPGEVYRGRFKGMTYTRHELTWTYNGGDTPSCTPNWKDKIGVCGHIHQLYYGCMEPRFYDEHNYYYLDAGCGCHRDAPLVAVNVESKEIIFSNEPKTRTGE